MRAFVMSGGGNRGALQAGALVALFERGIVPDMLVGSSAGALNAAFLATDPTLHGAQRIAEIWAGAKKDDFFPGDWGQMGWRLMHGESLFPSDALRQHAMDLIPEGMRTFGSLKKIRLYITTANLNTGRLYVWGGEDHPEASIVDAAVASAAHPLAFPPAKLDNYQLVDGGVVMNVPVGLAVSKGATEIYILNVGDYSSYVADKNDVVGILLRAIDVMMLQPFLLDVRHVTDHTDVKLHHIAMTEFEGGQLWEMDKCKEMVQAGKFAAEAYLDNPTGMGGIDFAPPLFEEVPPGAEVYVPEWMK